MRFFTYVLGIAIAATIVMAGTAWDAYAVDQSDWMSAPLHKVGQSSEPSPSYLQTMCSTTLGPIHVEGIDGITEGCVFGYEGGIRLAMYLNEGIFSYAIANATDVTFLPIVNFCVHYYRCVYSQSEDTVLLESHIVPVGTGHAVVKDFSKYLKLYRSDHRYYQFEYPNDFSYLNNGASNLRTGSVGISQNGRWAILEARSYGFIRMDIRTGEVRRIVAASSPYGHGFDPTYELAISNDGRQAVIAGHNTGLSIIDVANGCGDEVTVDTSHYFSESTIPCEYVPFDVYEMFPGFYLANVPRFSADNASLGVHITTGMETYLAQMAPLDSSEEAESSGVRRYVAFGDSFTSGEGELSDSFYLPVTNTSTNKCHVSTRSYPYLLQTRWETTAHNLACSGSRTNEVRKAVQVATANNLLTNPSLLSLSVGGNDVGLMGKLNSCLQPGTCEWADPERRIATAHEIKALLQPLTTLISEIKAQYIGTPLFIVGYPKVINDAHDASCGLVVSSLLSEDERIFMNQSIVYLNQVVRAAAHYSNVRFIDIENVFEGQRLCDDSSAAMNSLRYGDDIAPVPFIKTKFIGAESFHPTPYGHTLVAQAIHAQLGETFPEVLGCGCWFDDSQMAIPAYWMPNSESEWAAVRQFSETFIANSELVNGRKFSFEFSPGTFAPHQQVTFELHSDVVSLGTFTADADGSLLGEATLPDGSSGHHTVHAVGQSPSDASLDIYQAVFIQEQGTQPGVPESGVDDGEGATLAPVNQGHSRTAPTELSAASLGLDENGYALAPYTVPSSAPTDNRISSVLGVSTVDKVKTIGESQEGNGHGYILGTYAVLAVISALGLGCLYWYIRIKNREVD